MLKFNSDGERVYITKQGDMYDSISKEVYGDENYASVLIQLNPKYRRVVIFEEEVELLAPYITIQSNSSLPPWKQ